VVKSLVGEINRMKASKPVLASKVDDPVRPSSTSPSTPPTINPSPLEFQTCPVRPSAAARLSRSPSQGGAGVDPASPASVSGTAACVPTDPTACETAAAWAPSPAGLTDSAAGTNGVS